MDWNWARGDSSLNSLQFFSLLFLFVLFCFVLKSQCVNIIVPTSPLKRQRMRTIVDFRVEGREFAKGLPNKFITVGDYFIPNQFS